MPRASKNTNTALYRPETAYNLLDTPIIGSALKSRYGRLIFQIPLFIIAIALIYDGFTGPQRAPENLATIAPWVHYRGLVVLAILLVGNLFCMGCPFTVPRTLAKRFAAAGIRFPRILRNKYLALASLFSIFLLYEWLDLWASPALTAWVIVAYFVASFILEFAFKESVFCKYVCPLGSFNFVYSSTSPTQIAIKDHTKCQNCQGKECVNGSFTTETIIRIDHIPFIDAEGQMHYKELEVKNSPQGILGCGTELFPPQLTSNIDCVYCLDCVRACPHDNIGLMARMPGRELLKADAWPKRWDFSILVISLSFFSIVNAFGMVPPVFRLLEWFASIGFSNDLIPLILIFAVGGILVPVVASIGAAWFSRILTNSAQKYSLRDLVASFAPAFVPLGFGVWIAHYGFHFLIAPFSIFPVIQEFLGGKGDWQTFGGMLDPGLIGIVQIVALLGGFIWSMFIVQRVSERLFGRRNSFPGMLPWMLLLLFLMLAAYQVFTLPMEMRGTENIFAAIFLRLA
jgi:polyferredoxin